MRWPSRVGAPARRLVARVGLSPFVLYGDPGEKITVFPSQPAMMGCHLLHAAAMQGHRTAAPDDAGRKDAIAPSPTGSHMGLPLLWAIDGPHRAAAHFIWPTPLQVGKDWRFMQRTPLLWGADELQFRWVVDGLSASSCFPSIGCLFQIHRNKKGNMVKALQNKTCLVQNRTVQNNSEIKRNCCLVLIVCMFIIKIKLNNVHNKHNKQHKLMLSKYGLE